MNRSHWTGLCLVLVVTAQAEHENLSTQRPRLDGAEERVKQIFGEKCQSCHEGDGKFGDDNLPTGEWRDKVLASLNHDTGSRPMPPASGDPLTEEEKQLINQWAGRDTDNDSNACEGGSSPNPKIAQGIFSDRCVTCHGKLSFNPTSVLRPSHTQFLNNDGTLDETVLGDLSGVPGYALPEGKTSLGRILDALSNYTMPPRAFLPVLNKPEHRMIPELGTPHMTDAERQFLINFLKNRIQKENCPIKNWARAKGTGFPGMDFEEAAKACSRQGMRLPKYSQLEQVRSQYASGVTRKTCFWTSTFTYDEKREDERARRRVEFLEPGKRPQRGWATEGASCTAICVE